MQSNYPAESRDHHIYFSPHLDDAIYSCGGRIYRQRNEGKKVTVINLCAGQPPDEPLSPFAEQYHEIWGNSSNPMALRLEEDRKALSQWGVQGIYWKSSDAIYRKIHGEVIYPDISSLFGPPHPEDEKNLIEEWEKAWHELGFFPQEMRLYAPLGAGGHVDHVLVRNFARGLRNQGWDICFYEDFPHAYDSMTLHKALSEFGNVSWHSFSELINVEEKVRVMCLYESQISMMFSDQEDLKKRVKDFSAERAVDIHWGERIRKIIAGSGGKRERLWRRLFGYQAHAERYWSYE